MKMTSSPSRNLRFFGLTAAAAAAVAVVLVAISLAQTASAIVPNLQHKEFPSHRLPEDIEPLHYDLQFNFADGSTARGYQGKVKIAFEVLGKSTKRSRASRLGAKLKNLFLASSDCFGTRSKTSDSSNDDDDDYLHHDCTSNVRQPNQIFLHADLSSIEIHSIDLLNKNQQLMPEMQVLSKDYDSKRQLLALSFAKPLKPGFVGVLAFRFATNLRQDLRGLFQTNYHNSAFHEARGRFISSQFQPSDARLVFPCFDEPSLKATFDLTIKHLQEETALANMPVIERYDFEPGYTQTEFSRTPKMSPHMVAFVVGQFDFIESKYGSMERPVRVYFPLGIEPSSAQFALDTALHSLDYLEKYTSIKYPLPKFDIVSVYDHDKDNTESWGLAQIRSNLTFLDSETKEDFKLTIGVNVAHVVAHQWFANLITASWWDSLWITESVAAQMAFEIVSEMGMMESSNVLVRLATIAGVLQADAHVLRGYMHPLAPKLEDLSTSGQTYGIFDTIEFMKGASLAQLLQKTLGYEPWRDTLRVLLDKNAYGNVDRVDLEAAIEMATRVKSGSNYLKRFTSQIEQSSYPILNVDVSADKKVLIVEQKNVVAKDLSLEVHFHTDDEEENLLKLNLNQHDKQLEQTMKLNLNDLYPNWHFDWNNPKHTLVVDPIDPVNYITHYFRVNYSTSVYDDKMGSEISEKLIKPLDRLSILNDAVGLVSSGYLPASNFKRIYDYYQNEENTGVVLQMLVAAQVIKALNATGQLESSPTSGVFMRFYERYGFETPQLTGGADLLSISSGSFVDTRAQMATLTALVKAGVQPVIQAALAKFEAAPEGLIAELHLREPIYAAVIAHGTSEQRQLLLKHLYETQSLEERVRLLTVLLSSPETRERALDWIFQTSKLPKGTQADILASSRLPVEHFQQHQEPAAIKPSA